VQIKQVEHTLVEPDEYDPGVQFVHVRESDLYFPASHTVQVLPLCPIYPELHTHDSTAIEAVGEFEY